MKSATTKEPKMLAMMPRMSGQAKTINQLRGHVVSIRRDVCDNAVVLVCQGNGFHEVYWDGSSRKLTDTQVEREWCS